MVLGGKKLIFGTKSALAYPEFCTVKNPLSRFKIKYSTYYDMLNFDFCQKLIVFIGSFEPENLFLVF
jgi:hypothetical protein